MQGRSVQMMKLRVGRWRCRNAGCERKIFCQRLASVTCRRNESLGRSRPVGRLRPGRTARRAAEHTAGPACQRRYPVTPDQAGGPVTSALGTHCTPGKDLCSCRARHESESLPWVFKVTNCDLKLEIGPLRGKVRLAARIKISLDFCERFL